MNICELQSRYGIAKWNRRQVPPSNHQRQEVTVAFHQTRAGVRMLLRCARGCDRAALPSKRAWVVNRLDRPSPTP